MKTIRVYGDSFAAGATFGTPAVPVGWAYHLGKLLNLPVKNNAVDGSSTEYAIKTFIKDVENNVIGDNDIIFYVPSGLGRLYFSHQLDAAPSTASGYLRDPPSKINHDWYWDNKSHIEWWMVNNDRGMQSISFQSYMLVLKNFALVNPNCTIIILPTYDETLYFPQYPLFDKMSPVNYLKSKVYLSKVSRNEILVKDRKNFSWVDWQKFTKIDPRANHLTNINLTILVKLLAESIQTLNIDNITYEQFQNDIIQVITSKEQYLNYISDGMLTHRVDIEKNLS